MIMDGLVQACQRDGAFTRVCGQEFVLVIIQHFVVASGGGHMLRVGLGFPATIPSQWRTLASVLPALWRRVGHSDQNSMIRYIINRWFSCVCSILCLNKRNAQNHSRLTIIDCPETQVSTAGSRNTCYSSVLEAKFLNYFKATAVATVFLTFGGIDSKLL